MLHTNESQAICNSQETVVSKQVTHLHANLPLSREQNEGKTLDNIDVLCR